MSLTKPQTIEVCWNPSELLMAYQQALHIKIETEPLQIHGVFEAGNGQLYGSYYYDRLRDQKAQARINLLVPRHLKADLHDGMQVQLRGMLQRKINANGYFTLQFIARELLQQNAPESQDPDEIHRQELWEKRLQQPTAMIEEVLRSAWTQGKNPTICCLMPSGSIVEQEMKEAAGAAVDHFHWDLRRTAFHQKNVLFQSLREADADAPDLLALVRGGGEGLEIFNDPELAEQALELNSPWITALGHATDRLFLKKIAHQAFNTPTAFGQFLAQCFERYHEQHEHSKAKIRQEVMQHFHGQLQSMEKQQQLLQQQNKEQKELSEKWQLEARRQGEQITQLLRDMEQRQQQFLKEKEQLSQSIQQQQRQHESQHQRLQNKLRLAYIVAILAGLALTFSLIFLAR